MLAEALLAKYQHLGPGNEALGQLEAKMHCADAVKSIQLLRLSGLLTRPTTGIRQLSIGAGMAIKDLRAIHLYPEISMDDKGNLIFSVREDHPQDAVIVDGDPQWRKLYRDMNNCDQYKICACNEVSATALKKLPGKLRQREMGLRNAVFGLRIDHRMIPDAAAFFRQLVPVLDDSADLVITIGAGHGADDFAGRMKVLRELRDYLRNRGMMPVLLKMHGDGTPEEQRAGNYFGLMGHTTHEILYCSLEKASLAN
jgi:SAM-dependent methyltransferase